nr:hypothetical protein [Tanacetum cinerariifolium]
IQDGRVDIQSKNVGYARNGNRNAERPNLNQIAITGNGWFSRLKQMIRSFSGFHKLSQIWESQMFNATTAMQKDTMLVIVHNLTQYFRKQMLLAMKDEAGSNLNKEENDFVLDNAYGDYIGRAKRNKAKNQCRLNNELNKQKALLQKELQTCKERDTKEIRLKMKDKMIQLNYEKLNALYETFVPQQEITIEQTYFSTPSTSNVPSELSMEMSDLPLKKMPSESKLLQLLVELDNTIGRYDISMPALTKDHKGNKINTPYPVKTNTPY